MRNESTSTRWGVRLQVDREIGKEAVPQDIYHETYNEFRTLRDIFVGFRITMFGVLESTGKRQ